MADKKKQKKNVSGIGQTRFVVTGGSGSFGRNIIKRLLELGARNIVSISRDENVTREAESEIGSPYVKFKLGDITDKEFIANLMKNADIVFNAAAIKHVSLAEKNPREAYRVNILGLLNLLNASNGIKRFIHISSDKAIGVVNCYGATKLLGEYLVRESNQLYGENKYLVARCPNLFGSRGSVLDVWREQLKNSNTISVNDPEMTRYFISLSDAASFMVNLALDNKCDPNNIYYPLKATKKFKLNDLAKAFLQVHGDKNSKIIVTGASAGEKQHEDYIDDAPLSTVEELAHLIKKLD